VTSSRPRSLSMSSHSRTSARGRDPALANGSAAAPAATTSSSGSSGSGSGSAGGVSYSAIASSRRLRDHKEPTKHARELLQCVYLLALPRAPVDLSDGNRISSHTRTWILISDGVDQQIERPLHCRSVFMPRLVPMCYKHHRICATGLVLHSQRAPNVPRVNQS